MTRPKTRGGQPKYLDLAITICLTLGVVYKLPLRQTQGLMWSIVKLLRLEIPVPDFSTLSRRGLGLTLPARPRAGRTEPTHLVVDSTGLKIFGEGEWQHNKHKTKAKRKKWRKLHLGLDVLSGEIICADLTTDTFGDFTALPQLLDPVDAPVIRFLADGAYDGALTSDLLSPFGSVAVEIIIPLPKNANLSPDAAHKPTERDRHIDAIESMHGCFGKDPQATINVAASRHKWAVGKRSLDQNYGRATSKTKKLRLKSAPRFSTG